MTTYNLFNAFWLCSMACLFQVNGQNCTLPLYLEDKGFSIYYNGLKVELKTNFRLKMTYDLADDVMVNISSSYYGQLCGLCGNYNGNSKDDFQLPGGSLTTDVSVFGGSWQENLPGIKCSTGCGGPGNPCAVCPQKNLYQKATYCGVLLAPSGAFNTCRAYVDPTVYFNNCVSDVCQAAGATTVLCNSIKSYVSACQNAGVRDIPWRTKNFCPFKCPANSHYAICADTCSTSCAIITSAATCPSECSEGCQCNANYYLNGDSCVTLDKCGCQVEGRYYKILESFLKDQCGKLCTCQQDGYFTCQPYTCKKKCVLETDGSFNCRDITAVKPN